MRYLLLLSFVFIVMEVKSQCLADKAFKPKKDTIDKEIIIESNPTVMLKKSEGKYYLFIEKYNSLNRWDVSFQSGGFFMEGSTKLQDEGKGTPFKTVCDAKFAWLDYLRLFEQSDWEIIK